MTYMSIVMTDSNKKKIKKKVKKRNTKKLRLNTLLHIVWGFKKEMKLDYEWIYKRKRKTNWIE